MRIAVKKQIRIGNYPTHGTLELVLSRRGDGLDDRPRSARFHNLRSANGEIDNPSRDRPMPRAGLRAGRPPSWARSRPKSDGVIVDASPPNWSVPALKE